MEDIMAVLLELKENFKRFYNKYDIYIVPVAKFIAALVSFLMLNASIGYMDKLNSPIIAVLVSVICAFLPNGFTIVMLSIFMIAHLYAISVEFALIALCVVLLMYLLSKQIIEKNAQSISMTKILGFKNGEIGGLYIAATSIMVVISLVVSVPIVNAMLKWAFSSYLYTMMTGYIPYMVRRSCFVEMVILGIVCYAVVAVLQLVKISKIPKTDALKNVE